jgi:fibronectin type 3 domain-containing protein
VCFFRSRFWDKTDSIRDKKMTRKLLVLLSIIAIFSTGQALARDITLAWDENQETDIEGYRVYYKAGSSSLPLDGVAAAEGASPIDVQDNVTATLTGLPDGQIYYFAVTAYNTAGQESPLSEMVVSDWVPGLYYPVPNEVVTPAEVTFSWESAPIGDDMTYTLYYGTDPALEPANNLTSTTFQTPAKLAGGAFMGLIGFALAPRRRGKAILVIALLLAPVLISGCGGGGGGDGDGDGSNPALVGGISDDGAGPTIDGDRSTLETVAGLRDTYYTAFDLEPATKYYWKVVGTDAQGKTYESVSGSFTTEN